MARMRPLLPLLAFALLVRFCCLQEYGIVGYTMNLSMIEYKTLIIREDLEAAAQLLPSIPKVCWAGRAPVPRQTCTARDSHQTPPAHQPLSRQMLAVQTCECMVCIVQTWPLLLCLTYPRASMTDQVAESRGACRISTTRWPASWRAVAWWLRLCR